MFNWIKDLRYWVRHWNKEVSEYQKDTIIQSLPSVGYVNRAKKLIEEQKFKEAEEQLKIAEELSDKDALVYKYLGVVYDQTFRVADAVEAYQKSADLNPEDKNIWQKLGFALINLQEFDRATRAFENANKISPCNTDTFTGWGMSLMKKKKYAEAREKLLEAAKINRYNFASIFLSAVCEINIEMFDDAEAKLKFLIDVNPNESNNYEYAHLKFLKNNIEDTIYYAKKALEYNSNMLPAYLILGQCYALKFDDTAFSYYLQAEEKGLINESLYLEWGKSLLRFSKYQVAKHYLLKAIDMDNSNPEIIEQLALCNVLLDDMQDAPALIRKLTEVKPESLILGQICGILKLKNNDFQGTISTLKDNAEKLEENNFINYFYIAKAYEKLTNKTKVKEYYDSATLKNPKFIQAYIEHAKFDIAQNNYAQARRTLRKANKLEPDNTVVLNLLFHTSYILVKEDSCEYNVKETISIANKISPDLFEYPEELEDLKNTAK